MEGTAAHLLPLHVSLRPLVVVPTRGVGTRCITRFDRGLARLIAHEHLHSVLYRDHLPDECQLIPGAHYRSTGNGWHWISAKMG